MFGYGQLIHVKGKSALQIIFVIQVECISLKGYMFKRAFVASVSVLGGCSGMEVQLLECSIVDILGTDGRAMKFVMVFVREVVGRHYGHLVAACQGLVRR